MKLKLHPVNRLKKGNRWCGTAVISALTTCTTDDASYHIRKATGKTSVKGTNIYEIRKVLQSAGITCLNEYTSSGLYKDQTLTQWLKSKKRVAGKVYLLAAGNHWQLISGNRYVCGVTTDIVGLKHPKIMRRARVTEVYEVVAPDGVKKLRSKPKRKPNYKLMKLKKRAAELGIELEIDRTEIYDGKQEHQYYIGDPKELIEDGHYAWGNDELEQLLPEFIQAYEQAGATELKQAANPSS